MYLARLRTAVKSNLRQYFPLHLLVAVYIVVLILVSLMRHYAFLSSAWDLGIFNQAFYSTVSGGRFFYYTVELYANPGGSIFGVHFSPFLVFLLPFYAVFPRVETLLVLQTIAIALGVYPLFFLAKNVLGEKSLAVMFSILYLICPHLLSVNLFDFHADAFFVPLALSSLYFFSKQQWGKYFVFMTLAFSTKEFSSLPFFMLGLVEAWRVRKRIVDWVKGGALEDKRVLVSLFTMGLAVLWFISADTVIGLFEVHRSSSFVEGSPWAMLGGNPLNPSILWSLTRLDYAGALQFDFSSKLLYFFTLMGPFVFLPLLALASFAPTLVWLVPSFLSNYPPYYTLGYHYSAFIIPFITFAAIYGYRNFLDSMKVTKQRAPSILKKLVLCSILFTLSVSVTTQSLGMGVRLSMISAHDSLVYEVLELIPRNASVLTQFDIFPHLSDRTNSFVIPPRFEAFKEPAYRSYVETLFNEQTEFILIDIDPDSRLAAHRAVSAVALTQIEETGGYGLYASVDGILLYKLGYEGSLELYEPLTMIEEFKPQLRLGYSDAVLLDQSLPKGTYNATLRMEAGESVDGRLFTFKIKQGEYTIAFDHVYGELFFSESCDFSLSFSVVSQLKEIRFVITDSTGLTDLYVNSIEIRQGDLD
jgi:uncharacterized membrane protein